MTIVSRPTEESRPHASRKTREMRKNFALWESLLVFHALAHRLEMLKVKLGAVDTTARITTTQ